MGFSTVAASVIIFAGLLFLAGTVANAVFEAQRVTDRSAREKADREQMRIDTRIALSNANWQGNRVHVYIENQGGTSLDADAIEVFIDGVHGTQHIDQLRVDGNPGGLWGPGQELYLRIDPPGQKPTRIYVVTETGTGLVAEV